MLLAKRFLLILELGPSSEAQTTSLGKVAYSYLMTFDKDGARVVNTAKGKAAADYLGLAELSFTALRTYRGQYAGSPALGHSIKD